MPATRLKYRVYRRYIWYIILYRGLGFRGNIRVILRLYEDNGKEKGNYSLGFRVWVPGGGIAGQKVI